MNDKKCTYIKNNGEKCQRNAMKGEDFCWSHRPKDYKPKWRGGIQFNGKVNFRLENVEYKDRLNRIRQRKELKAYCDYDVQWHVFIKMKPYSIRNGQIQDPETGEYVPVLSAVKGAPLAVWLYLASCIDDVKRAYPGRATISKATGYSKTTISKATKRLEQLGLIQIHRNFKPGAKEEVNTYWINDYFFAFCDNKE